MLDFMRKKAGSWMIKILLFAIVLVFIFWGVGSFNSRKDTQVADVNGTIISHEVYRQTYFRLLEQFRSRYGSQLNDEVLKMLRVNEQALDQLVNRVLMLQEAERLALDVAEAELTDSIRKIPAFQQNGAFSFEIYRAILAQNTISTDAFEKEQKENMLLDQLRVLVSGGVMVSEAEARQWFDWYNTQINLSYLLFSPERHKDISASEADLAKFFKEHENDYRTDPQVKVRFLYFDPKSFEPKVSITDDDIAQYYDSHLEEFKTEKTVEASHILLKVDQQADASAVAAQEKKAMDIYQMAKEAKRSFADLAKEYSEDSTAEKGGYLGAFSKERMVKPFADQAFAMQAGEVSEPVRTQFGWHIIKVEKVNEATTKTLSEASDALRAKLMTAKCRSLAFEQAGDVYDLLFDGDDLTKVGQAHQVPVRTTDFFTAQNPPKEGIGDPRQFGQIALGLEKLAISEILELEDGYYLLQVSDRIESAIPALSAVTDRVKADLIKARQDELSKADAQACMAELQKGKSIAEAATAYGLTVEETGFFGRNAEIPKVGNEQEISRVGFELSIKKPLAEKIIAGRLGSYVLSLKERKVPAGDGFEKEKQAIVSRLTEQKKQEVFQTWLADLKSRAKIDINRELIQ